MAPSDHDVVAPPGELLDVGAVVGQGHAPAVVAHVVRLNVRDSVKVLEWRRQKMSVVDQVTQSNAGPRINLKINK